MSLVKGPFDLEWGGNTLAGIETLDVSYDVKTTDLDTIQGKTYELSGAHKVAAVATFIDTDTAALAVVLPQHHVANGGTLSTGEIVTDVNGAIDIVPSNNVAASQTHGLIITSAGVPGQVARIVDATTEIAGVEFDGTIRKIKVRFTGDAGTDKATMQFFKEGAVSNVS